MATSLDPITERGYRCRPDDPCGRCDYCMDEDETWAAANPPPVGPYEDLRKLVPQNKGTSLVDKMRLRMLDTEQVRNLPPPLYLINNYLVDNSLAMLYGGSGSGKTFLALDWAQSVSRGADWLGNEVSEPGEVLYVIAEGASGIGRRIGAWEAHYKNRLILDAKPITWLPGAVNLTDNVEVACFAALASEFCPALIVIDTLARCSVGAEENSAKDMGLVIENLDLIRNESGACVLVVHHSGKDTNNGARGSSALRGAMDTEIELSAAEHRVTVKVKKQKDGAEAEPLRLDRTPSAESCVLVLAGSNTKDSPDLSTGDRETLEALRSISKPGGVPDGEWKEVAMQNCSKATYYNRRARLIAAGLVLNVGTDQRPRYLVCDTSNETDGPDEVQRSTPMGGVDLDWTTSDQESTSPARPELDQDWTELDQVNGR